MAETDIIRDMELVIMEMMDNEQALAEEVHYIKADCTMDVEAEFEESKDKALSNATKRTVEVDLRLEGDLEYKNKVALLNSVRMQIKRAGIDLAFQKREFQRLMKE